MNTLIIRSKAGNLAMTFAMLLFSLFAMSLTAFGQCDANGLDPNSSVCSETPWVSHTYEYDDPRFSPCVLSIVYETRECDGITYIRNESCYWENSTECDALTFFLLPNGAANGFDGKHLWELWMNALDIITNQYASTQFAQYHCPNKFIIRTIMPGGCASTQLAVKTYGTNNSNTRNISKFIPCTLEAGCCVIEKTVCMDDDAIPPGPVYSNLTTQYVAPGDCSSRTPILDPDPWALYDKSHLTIYPASSCNLSCWMY